VDRARPVRVRLPGDPERAVAPGGGRLHVDARVGGHGHRAARAVRSAGCRVHVPLLVHLRRIEHGDAHARRHDAGAEHVRPFPADDLPCPGRLELFALEPVAGDLERVEAVAEAVPGAVDRAVVGRGHGRLVVVADALGDACDRGHLRLEPGEIVDPDLPGGRVVRRGGDHEQLQRAVLGDGHRRAEAAPLGRHVLPGGDELPVGCAGGDDPQHELRAVGRFGPDLELIAVLCLDGHAAFEVKGLLRAGHLAGQTVLAGMGLAGIGHQRMLGVGSPADRALLEAAVGEQIDRLGGQGRQPGQERGRQQCDDRESCSRDHGRVLLKRLWVASL